MREEIISHRADYRSGIMELQKPLSRHRDTLQIGACHVSAY
jgi:hypothetical protein